MTNEQFWVALQIGFNDFTNDEVTFPLPPPFDENDMTSEGSLLSQHSYEFGIMSAREGFELNREELDYYIEEVRYSKGL